MIIKIPAGLLLDRIQSYIVCFVSSKSVQLSQCEGRLQFPWFHGVIHVTPEGRRQSKLLRMKPVQVDQSQYWLEEWYEIQVGMQAAWFVIDKLHLLAMQSSF